MVKPKKVDKKKETKSEGVSLDDAFADDEDVVYRESKPKKIKKTEDEDLEKDIPSVDDGSIEKNIQITASKPIDKIKKGDKIRIDGKEYEVDAHYILIDHKTTQEMAIEIFDSKTDKDYQLRYFNDQAEKTLEMYELNEIIYNKKPFSKIEW